MNISEAIATMALTKLLEGNPTSNADDLLEQVVFLRDRATAALAAGKPLDQAETRSTIVHLIQRHTDTLDQINLDDPAEVDCPACAGVGETYWNATRDPALEQRKTCGRCGGTGALDAIELHVTPETVTTGGQH